MATRLLNLFLPDKTGTKKDDYVIVSYPKSGNTWVRFLVANYLYPDEKVDFHTIHKLIPEIASSYKIKSRISPCRIFKSHSSFRSDFRNVIYVVRDGRDVYTSYYHYLKNKIPDDFTFEDFLSDEKHRQGDWSTHVVSWIEGTEELSSFLVVRYEDLLTDCAGELRRILKFLDISGLQNQRIQRSVEASSFESMRKLEARKGRPHAEKDQADRFIRKGKSGDWINHFSEKEKKIFKEREGEILVRLGYEEDMHW